MVQGIASGQSIYSIKNILNDFALSIKNASSFTDKDIESINAEFIDKYNEFNSTFRKIYSKEEFKSTIEGMYERTVCGTTLHNPDDPRLKEIDMNSMPVNIEVEFNKYLESRDCANEQELQALNKTPFRTVGELRRSAEARMMCSLSNLNKDKVPYAMLMSKELVSGVNIDNLGKYVKANVYEAAKMAQGFMQNYSGGSLNPQELLAVQREFSAYMNILENQEKEAQKHINPQDQLKRVDYSQYDDKYGEKYAQNLAINYETTKCL